MFSALFGATNNLSTIANSKEIIQLRINEIKVAENHKILYPFITVNKNDIKINIFRDIVHTVVDAAVVNLAI